MKRSLGSSDSLGALMSMCPPAEEHSPGSNHIYNSTDYQSMLDGLDEDGHVPEKKRRLGVDQVKALERYFDKETKLEPESKVKLAQELGLQPRQVAVWFQNRRARWKTKQLERDYGVLKSSFDDLKNNYESLQHDKEALLKEIKELRSKLKEDHKSTESNFSLSIKEEALLSKCDNNKTTEAVNHTINPTASLSLNVGSEAANLNNVTLITEFKDGSSDSDSSAILNEDQSPNASNSSSGLVQNDQNLTSPNSFRFNCSSPQFVKMEEHNFFGGEEPCNFFSYEQAPTLHWYCPDQWN